MICLTGDPSSPTGASAWTPTKAMSFTRTGFIIWGARRAYKALPFLTINWKYGENFTFHRRKLGFLGNLKKWGLFRNLTLLFAKYEIAGATIVGITCNLRPTDWDSPTTFENFPKIYCLFSTNFWESGTFIGENVIILWERTRAGWPTGKPENFLGSHNSGGPFRHKG